MINGGVKVVSGLLYFWGNQKEIPFAHIKTNLTSMNISKEEFWNWIKENC